MNVTVTGVSGFIGRRLIAALTQQGHTVRALRRTDWDMLAGEPSPDALESADAIVHLAGEPVAQRWTAEAKRKIAGSRLQGTRNLVTALSTLSRRPAVLVCASAIGIYGDRDDEVLTETSPLGTGFLASLCRDWEKQASLAEALGIRVVKLRTGIVLGADGGALHEMLPPFKAFVGGRLGSGQQWMSWIHVDDLVALVIHAIQKTVSGPLNGTAPNPVRNTQFTRELASALHRPALFPVPAFALKLMFGEMSEVLLGSQRVLPKAAEASGFRFTFPELGPALHSILH